MTRLPAATAQKGEAIPVVAMTAQRRPDRPRQIVTRAVSGGGVVEIVARHHQRRDRRPARRGQRAAGAKREGGQQQRRRRRQLQRDGRRENRGENRHQGFDEDQQPPGIDNVGERAGRQGEEEHRQGGHDLDHRDGHRAGVEAGHQPARAGVEHRKADIGDDARRPDDREGRLAERAPARGFRLRRLSVQIRAQFALPAPAQPPKARSDPVEAESDKEFHQ